MIHVPSASTLGAGWFPVTGQARLLRSVKERPCACGIERREGDLRGLEKVTARAGMRLFDELVPKTGDVGRRPMFGYPAAFANGYLFAGLFEARMLLRLGTHLDAFRALGGEPFEPMPGRPMAGFLLVPPALLADVGALIPWIDRALETALSLPARPVKAKRPPRHL